ncbi:hypothetical protein [Cylindrospermum sp. FACHB-282]|uniref:hypothetical protein n=1 Tax=Cylindrospermum sp. FACHB-282 TaxID=2692794 RepID=UPI00168718E1|nr:hypothetical protein [Cylindrospermum sp. FACHB-282]MBD2387323.1 hypothetical protein [Cylindrospermum sp. FACHB-282]
MPIELNRFSKNLSYELTAPIQNIVVDLQEIAEIDKLAEIKQKQSGKKALYYFLGLVASVVVIFIIPIFAVVIILVVLGLIIVFIRELITWFKFSKLNISNYRYEVAKQILQMLDRDIEKTADVELQLSFQPIDKKEYKTTTMPHPDKSGWKIDNHEHVWLKIQGQFLDKTRFQLTANGLSKRQYGWKRSSSGKSKHKSKTKSRGLDISLILNYSQRRYRSVKILENEISDAVKLPATSYMRGVKVTDKEMHLVVRVASQMAENKEEIYQTIAMMFLSLYQVLNLAKKLAK